MAKVDSDPYALQYMPGGGAGAAKTAVGLSQGAALRRGTTHGAGGSSVTSYATPRSAARLGNRRMAGMTPFASALGGAGGTSATPHHRSLLTSPDVNPELNTDMLVSRRNLRRLGALEAPPEVRIYILIHCSCVLTFVS